MFSRALLYKEVQMKTNRNQKVYIPKNLRITTSNKEVHTIYFRGYSEEYDGDNYIVSRNTRKEGYLVSYACEHWCIGYEEPDFGEGNIATFCSFRSALNWVNKYGNVNYPYPKRFGFPLNSLPD